jgi:hypothetical protein
VYVPYVQPPSVTDDVWEGACGWGFWRIGSPRDLRLMSQAQPDRKHWCFNWRSVVEMFTDTRRQPSLGMEMCQTFLCSSWRKPWRGFENGKAPGKVNEQSLRTWHSPNAMRGDMGFHKAWPAEFSMFPLSTSSMQCSSRMPSMAVLSAMLPCVDINLAQSRLLFWVCRRNLSSGSRQESQEFASCQSFQVALVEVEIFPPK